MTEKGYLKQKEILDTPVWNRALEHAAMKLKEWYSDNEQTNAFCAAVRSLKK